MHWPGEVASQTYIPHSPLEEDNICAIAADSASPVKHLLMKATLVLLLVLIGAGAFAQTASIRVLHRSGAHAPLISEINSNKQKSPGYLTLVTESPLVVAECPGISYINRASVVVNLDSSSLTIDFKEDIPTQRITVAISNDVGELVKSESFFATEREKTVSLPNLKSITIYANRYNIAVYQEDKRVLYWGQYVK